MSVERIIAGIPTLDQAERKRLRANAEAKLGDAARMADARRVIEALDMQAALEKAELSEHVRGLPRVQRIVQAFTRSPMTETERKLVQVLLDNPGESSEGLSRALGWGGTTWHMHFGTMCKDREANLWPADPSAIRDAAFYSGILADLSDANRWTMKPEAVTALAELGLHARPGPSP